MNIDLVSLVFQTLAQGHYILASGAPFSIEAVIEGKKCVLFDSRDDHSLEEMEDADFEQLDR